MEKEKIISELSFKAVRSSGAGGQNVNKVETMVEGYFNVQASRLFSLAQKELISKKLANKITDEGFLLVKSQTLELFPEEVYISQQKKKRN